MKKLLPLLILCISFYSNAQLSVSFSVTHCTCYGSTNGQVVATASGGTAPYTYQWSNMPPAYNNATISNLGASYYGVTVKDATNTTVMGGTNVNQPTQVNVGSTSTEDVSCFRCSDGAIAIDPTGGTPPYEYEWKDGPTSQDRYQLGAGNYEVTITDDHACTKVWQTNITEPPADMWLMGGNENSDPQTQFIGTQDEEDLVIKTDDEERIRIDVDGLIKIMHHLRYVSYADTDTIPRSLQINPNGDILPSGPIINPNIGCTQIIPWLNGIVANSVSLCNPNLNVGIGTNAPASKLDVAGNMRIGSTYAISSNYAPTNGLLVEGKVGIGTYDFPSTGSCMLAVKGNIIAEEVKVKLYANWDRVFMPNYNLRSLSELKMFLEENHHLPDVQSYAEMTKDEGVNVGDMQMKLLRKIEELTLYIIEQDKRIEALEKGIK
jgi:hypothetical protein